MERSYEELPTEVLLKIFMQVDKPTLLALRVVSSICNQVVLDTPLGMAWGMPFLFPLLLLSFVSTLV